MIDIKDLMKDGTKHLTLSNGIEVDIKAKLSIKEQQEIMGSYTKGITDELGSAIDMAFQLIKSWNLEDDNQPVELTFEIFSSLPLSFEDVNKIVSES